MEVMEIAKTTLSEMLETAGENGVTEGQVLAEIRKRGCHFGHYETINALKSVYKEMGLKRTEPHTGKVICYYKPKKEPEESAAVRLAKKLGKRTIGERERMNIINQYR